VEKGSVPLPVDLAGLDRDALAEAVAALGVPAFHGRQIFHWIHARGVTDFTQMTDLSRPLRDKLAASFRISALVLESRQVSSDGTIKYLLRLDDGQRIESVYIPDTPAQTFCVSTQVGCAMACGFCLTGKMGLTRHLTAAEIVGQVRVLAHDTALAGKIFNIVLMGMGEPLHNYDATMQAIRILADDRGLAVHPRRVTLSTVGIVPAIEKLAAEPLMPSLAISLHATTDAQRDALVPINRRYPIAELIAAVRRLPARRRGRITFEYVLLAGVNDTPEDAARLAALLGDMKAKVNLLPLNEAAGIPFKRPSDERVDRFGRLLADRGVVVSVRKSRGRDIRAACGQLIVEGQIKTAGRRLAAAMRDA
jgi:23S rRNA (adenine2503-C2)-methyltransferase